MSKILIVDDDFSIAQLLSDALEDEGFETVVVTVGVVGDEFTEILSGLSEGDEVYAQTTSSSSGMMGGMRMGGMSGGMRMPTGGGMRMPTGGGMRR